MERVVLAIRHGDVLNEAGGIYGHLPVGLSELGRSQAKALATALFGRPIAVINSSPLKRALETAELLSEKVGVSVIEDPRLLEWRFWESFQGRHLTEPERVELQKLRAHLLAHPDDQIAGESFNDFRARLRSWLDEARQVPYGVVIGVTHFDAIRTLLLESGCLDVSKWREASAEHCEVVRLHPAPSIVALGCDSIEEAFTG